MSGAGVGGRGGERRHPPPPVAKLRAGAARRAPWQHPVTWRWPLTRRCRRHRCPPRTIPAATRDIAAGRLPQRGGGAREAAALASSAVMPLPTNAVAVGEASGLLQRHPSLDLG